MHKKMHISEGKSYCDKTCVENLRNSRVVYQLQSLVSSGNGAFLLGEKRYQCQDFLFPEILRKTPVNGFAFFHYKFILGIETDFNRSREPLIFHGVLLFLKFNSVGPQSTQHIHDGHFGIKFVDTHVHACYNIFLWISQFTFFTLDHTCYQWCWE